MADVEEMDGPLNPRYSSYQTLSLTLSQVHRQEQGGRQARACQAEGEAHGEEGPGRAEGPQPSQPPPVVDTVYYTTVQYILSQIGFFNAFLA